MHCSPFGGWIKCAACALYWIKFKLKSGNGSAVAKLVLPSYSVVLLLSCSGERASFYSWPDKLVMFFFSYNVLSSNSVLVFTSWPRTKHVAGWS